MRTSTRIVLETLGDYYVTFFTIMAFMYGTLALVGANLTVHISTTEAGLLLLVAFMGAMLQGLRYHARELRDRLDRLDVEKVSVARRLDRLEEKSR